MQLRSSAGMRYRTKSESCLAQQTVFLNEMGIPTVCETDIHGAITALMVEAATLDDTRSFFCGLDGSSSDQRQCGAFAALRSMANLRCRERPSIGYPVAFDFPGSISAEAKHGKSRWRALTETTANTRFLLGKAKGVDGPYTKGHLSVGRS